MNTVGYVQTEEYQRLKYVARSVKVLNSFTLEKKL